MSLEQNPKFQLMLDKILQQSEQSAKQTEVLQKQVVALTQRVSKSTQSHKNIQLHKSTQLQKQLVEYKSEIERLHHQVNALTAEKDALAQTVHHLTANKADLERHILDERQRLVKYKGLWTVQLFKPFVKTEQIISSTNRYRKGFRLLVKEKGSIGKAYQFLRKTYKATHSIREVKQILKFPQLAATATAQAPVAAPTIPLDFIQSVKKQANEIFALKVLIIAEMSIPQCKKYRVTQKQEMLQAAGIPCEVVSWTDYEAAKQQISLASLVIFYRVPGFDQVMSLISECNRLNIKTLWDVDDLIFDEAVLKASTTIKALDKAEREGLLNGARLYRQAMLACDEGIASTTGLANAMREAGLKTVHIVENALDHETQDTAEQINANTRRSGGKIRIIYGSGTKTHNIDFLEAAPAIAKVLQKNSNVIFRVIGFLELPSYFKPLESQIERISFCNYTEYLSYLAECDISIAPLDNFIFNDAKSNIKYIEASIVKVASVCSPRLAFSERITNGENGFLADNEAQWLNALETLVNNTELRLQIAEAAHANVMGHYHPTAISKQMLSAVAPEKFERNNKVRVLTFNVYYYPQSFGGATIVAEQLNKLLAAKGTEEIYAVTTLPVIGGHLRPYDTVRYEYQGVTVFGIAVPGEDLGRFSNGKFNAAVKNILALVQPDIAHIHCIQGMGVETVELCRRRGVKTLLTLHDAWWLCARQFMINNKQKFCNQKKLNLSVCASCCGKDVNLKSRTKVVGGALDKVDMLVAPSQYFADFCAVNVSKPVLVNKNGVIRPQKLLPKNKPETLRFGYVGGNTNIKGVHLILDAFRKYDFPQTELVVVDNMLNVGRQSFFDKDFSGISNYRIIPAYNQETIDQFFAEIDVLLFPTQWKESFGLTVREAILRNVWVIATDAGGVSEDIIDGKNGTIIPFDSDSEDLSRAIEAVCEHYQELEDDAIIDLPKDHIRSFEEQQEELSEMYQKLLSV